MVIRIYEYDIIVSFLFFETNIIYHYIDQYNVQDTSSNLDYDVQQNRFFC